MSCRAELRGINFQRQNNSLATSSEVRLCVPRKEKFYKLSNSALELVKLISLFNSAVNECFVDSETLMGNCQIFALNLEQDSPTNFSTEIKKLRDRCAVVLKNTLAVSTDTEPLIKCTLKYHLSAITHLRNGQNDIAIKEIDEIIKSAKKLASIYKNLDKAFSSFLFDEAWELQSDIRQGKGLIRDKLFHILPKLDQEIMLNKAEHFLKIHDSIPKLLTFFESICRTLTNFQWGLRSIQSLFFRLSTDSIINREDDTLFDEESMTFINWRSSFLDWRMLADTNKIMTATLQGVIEQFDNVHSEKSKIYSKN